MGRSLFPVNLKSGMSVFLLVISVNHTHTRFKVSFKRILLTGKSALANREYTTQGLAPFPPISLSYHQWVGCGGPLQGLFPVCQRLASAYGDNHSVKKSIPQPIHKVTIRRFLGMLMTRRRQGQGSVQSTVSQRQ